MKQILLTSLFLLFIVPLVSAQQNVQRKTFLQAEKQLWQPDSIRYNELYNKLHYYPLQPYLDQKRLMLNMKLSDHDEINRFLTKYKGSPLDWPLRKKWLKYLAKKGNRLLFIQYFRPNNDASLNCQHLLYRLASGLPESVVLPQVTKLWVVGKSQSKTCDPLFKKWQVAGYRTKDVIWQRIKLAADGGKHTLIPYLTNLLPADEQYLGDLWRKTRSDPAYITRLKRFPEKSSKEAEIITYGLKRLIWRDPSRAIKTFKTAKQQFKFLDKQINAITGKFAIALASKGHDEAGVWLNNVDKTFLTKDMIQWKLVEVLKNKDWSTLMTELVSLPAKYKQELQWKYWYGRALIETKKTKRGEYLLAQLATERHYYGFLAASAINAPFSMKDKPLNITAEERNAVLRNEAAKRAFEFFYLNRFHEARREWNYWLSQLSNRQKLVAAKVANEKEWFDRAIFTLSKVGYMDDVDLRFPQAYSNEIIKHATEQKINPTWAFAITRRESSFMTDANSPVGAKGLMQLMPNTAKQLRKKKTTSSYLFNSENNIKLGTKYLRQLLNKSKGNLVIATASYNAGPYRVKNWLKNTGNIPADIWIETIPYKETRNYVKSVLAYQQIYQHQTGDPASVFEDVIKMNMSD